jgi:heme exporter protein A
VQTLVVVKNLTKAYRYRKLFSDLSFVVEENTVFAVLGANGAGKTTLLRIICDLAPVTSGKVEITVGGRLLETAERRALLGLVSPDLELYGELSALENLEFFAGVRGTPFSREKAREMLEYVGLKGRGHDFVSTYSSGMKQRLKYAYALFHDPRILILDEPTSNLDSKGVALVEQVIRRQRERGIVIMATNEQREVSYADRTLSLA